MGKGRHSVGMWVFVVGYSKVQCVRCWERGGMS